MKMRNALPAAAAVLAGMFALRMLTRTLTRHALDGGAVLVTGGSRGLGLAIAIECAQRGARLAICGRDPETLARAARRLRTEGAQVLTIQCDLRDPVQAREAVRRTVDAYGRIDMLVNNAGTIAVGPMASMTREDYEDAMNTHFWAMYDTVEAALPIFLQQGRGSIVNITSIGGKISVPHLLPYSVSKFAAVGYSEGLRAELRPKNVTVTTVCPGLMRTGSPRNASFKAQHEKEYAWFTLSDTLPVVSIAASTAARTIVDAAVRGESEIVLSLPAKAGVLLHGVAPGFVSNALQIGTRLLPGPGGIDRDKRTGAQSASPVTESPLTALGKKAERDYNQIG